MSSYLIYAISYFDNSANEIVAETEHKVFWRKFDGKCINIFIQIIYFF